jgi:hypothetical protein
MGSAAVVDLEMLWREPALEQLPHPSDTAHLG